MSDGSRPRQFEIERRPSPFRPLAQHDGSLLRTLFRGARYPNCEWWLYTAHATARAANGRLRELTIAVGVQLTAAPVRAEVVSSFVTVRDQRSSQHWVARSEGRMSGTAALRYSAPAWFVLRLDPSHVTFDYDAISVGRTPEALKLEHPQGCCVCQVRTAALELDVSFGSTCGLALSRDGWVDYCPRAETPLWMATQLRSGALTGTLRLAGKDGKLRALEIVRGASHFEHRCVMLSASASWHPDYILSGAHALTTLRTFVREPRVWSRYRAALGEVTFFAEAMCSVDSPIPIFQQAFLARGFGERAEACSCSLELTSQRATWTVCHEGARYVLAFVPDAHVGLPYAAGILGTSNIMRCTVQREDAPGLAAIGFIDTLLLGVLDAERSA